MTIASEIQRINTNIENAYTACNNKGATMPVTQNSANLATCIGTISTGGSPVIQSLGITPTTSSQTITAPSGIDGYSPISVSAVDSNIDANILSSNIKNGVTILGVTGSLVELIGETRSVSLTNKNGQTFTPTTGKNGITLIAVEPTNEARTVNPSTSSQSLTVNSGYSGNGTITVNPVTSSIDANITAGNIKNGVTILGVTGNYTGGGTTLITKSITQNGTYNATSDNADGYSSVTVNVAGAGVGLPREVSAQGVYQMPTSNFTFSLPSNATNVGAMAMYYGLYGCTGLTTADLSSLTTVTGSSAMYNAFASCTSLTSVDLSSLTTVNGSSAMQSVFYFCTNLTTVDLSSLTTVNGSSAMGTAFYGCTNLTTIDLSNITTITGTSAMGTTFYNCRGLTGTLDLSSVTTITGSNTMSSTFYGCSGLTSIDLSSLTTVNGNQVMSGTFYGCTNLASVLFTNLETIGLNTSTGDNRQFTSCFNSNALTSITFPKLKEIYCTGGTTASYGTFANNTKVEKLYFPKLDTITYGSGASTSNQEACKNVFYGCSALTELHFGAANQAAIEASPGYSTAWGRGAGNVTIYFDL